MNVGTNRGPFKQPCGPEVAPAYSSGVGAPTGALDCTKQIFYIC